MQKKYNGYEIGPNLRQIRKDRKLSVYQVSESTGLSNSSINQIEQGSRGLSMNALYLLSPEDRLSDNVYHYDAQEKVFELGEKFAERQNEREAPMEEKGADKESVLGELKAKKEEVAKQPKKEAVEKAVGKNKGGEAI